MSDVIKLSLIDSSQVIKVKLTQQVVTRVALSKVAIPDPRVAQALADSLNARDAAISAAETAVEAVSSINQVVEDALSEALSEIDTDQVPEGDNNLYYTQSRFDEAFSEKDTDDLSEGANKFFSDSLAQNATVVDSTAGAQTNKAPSVASVKTLVSGHASNKNTHGVTGDLVGTTDTQTLSNKTITSPEINNGSINGSSINNPSRAGVKEDTKANLITYALTANNGQFVFATDEKKMYQILDGLLGPVGGNSGSLETILQLFGEDQITDWSKGNSATFMGGGTLAGTFTINTTDPLHSSSDYKYTQASGSLNDYFASKAFSVGKRFRGKDVTLYFPLLYNGLANDIQTIFYDDTNAAIIPSSIYIPVASSPGIFKTNITVPPTCAGIRIGFHVKALNNGAVFQFDDVQLTADTTVMAPIASQFQSSYIRTTSTITANTNIIGALTESKGSGNYSYNASTGLYTILKDGVDVRIGCAVNVGSGAIFAIINIKGVEVIRGSVDGRSASTSWGQILNAGDTFSAYSGNSASTISSVYVSTVSVNTNILTPPDVISNETTGFVWYGTGSYNLASLANAPVGAMISFTYAANTNTRSQANSAPTQTLADMSLNGILLYARNYTSTSTTGQPCAYAIQIGKNLQGVKLGLFKSSGKTTKGSIRFDVLGSSSEWGCAVREYDENTGVLLIDAGYVQTQSKQFFFSDLSSQSSGYLFFSGSKNPALTGLNIQSYMMESQGNAGQAITANSTNIPFIGVTDTLGEWNGSVFTPYYPGKYTFQVGVLYTAGVSTGLGYVRGGNTYRFTTPASSASFHAGSFSVNLAKGETISIRSVDAGGTLSNGISHKLTVTKSNVG